MERSRISPKRAIPEILVIHRMRDSDLFTFAPQKRRHAAYDRSRATRIANYRIILVFHLEPHSTVILSPPIFSPFLSFSFFSFLFFYHCYWTRRTNEEILNERTLPVLRHAFRTVSLTK